MGKTYAAITPELHEWMARQPMFFVATAPLDAEGHINCSPKGGADTFRAVDPETFAYLDLTGSGVETIAHLQENARIVVMFCAFEGPPKIARLHGRGKVVYPADPAFAALASHFPDHPGVRAIIRVSVDRVSDSCGFSVPLMEYQSDRTILDDWARNKGSDGLAAYRQEKNATSIDGIPGYGGLPSRG